MNTAFALTTIDKHRKSGASPEGGQWYPPPISCLAAPLLHTSKIVHKKCGPICVFCPHCCEILATGLQEIRAKAFGTTQEDNGARTCNQHRAIVQIFAVREPVRRPLFIGSPRFVKRQLVSAPSRPFRFPSSICRAAWRSTPACRGRCRRSNTSRPRCRPRTRLAGT